MGMQVPAITFKDLRDGGLFNETIESNVTYFISELFCVKVPSIVTIL